jgi:segregation and condensation protein B
VEIREIAGGYRMATKPECHDAVRLFVKSLKPPMKLSLPALETLAVIAYKQPVTAPEVNEIRGVESAGVLGSLLARKLIATAGRKPVIGRPILYKTTKEFLLRFGLKDVSELPSMEEFEKMAATELEMEPEVVEADKAENAEEMEENGASELESNSPSGEEMVAAAAIEGGTEEGAAVNTDAAETSAVEPDAVEPDVAGAVSAETDSKVPGSGDGAETEATSNAEESKNEG